MDPKEELESIVCFSKRVGPDTASNNKQDDNSELKAERALRPEYHTNWKENYNTLRAAAMAGS